MKILILGCGWVGEELALNYLNRGIEVFVTCTSEEKKIRLQGLGLHAACVNFDKDSDVISFPREFDYILVSIPASSRAEQIVLEQRFTNVVTYLQTLTYAKAIFLSSTGIYPDKDGTFDEDHSEELNVRLLYAENKLASNIPIIIYRLGGLFGKNRIFAKYFQRKVCTTGNQPANFVHLDDVVALIIEGFDNDLSLGIYNIVAPEHPSKEEIIKASAKKYGFDMPASYDPQQSFQKIVIGDKIIESLDYRFKYASPLYF